jgi:hypothetical protein
MILSRQGRKRMFIGFARWMFRGVRSQQLNVHILASVAFQGRIMLHDICVIPGC